MSKQPASPLEFRALPNLFLSVLPDECVEKILVNRILKATYIPTALK